ncbi:MAG: TlpA family protein disulfide reductase [Saprospiraceae bacterium]|nr:TlpA family protein disulfide reductase [Saprospiraceae bacterium]
MMYKTLITSFLFIFSVILLSRCVTTDTAYSRVAPGMWRGVLELEKYRVAVNDKDTIMILYDQFKPGELPFNFEITYTDEERFYVEIINGSERIRLDSIQYGRDRSQARDTMNIWFPEYQSYIHAEIRGGVMQGEWVVTTKEDYRIPFYAHAGRGYRFTPLQETPVRDLTGSWPTLFGVEGKPEDQEKAIGEFKQKGNHLEGTFRTETGDYRFLEGTVQGRKFFLSCFDGAHAYLFSGSIKNDTLQGEFRSGHRYQTLWTGWQDPQFKLGAADSLTQLKKGAAVRFAVKTPEGKDLVYPSPAFDNKIKVFTVMGTWCPNCRDEQVFLTEFLKENPDVAQEMAVVGFAFERNKEVAQSNAHLSAYKKKMGIPFEIVYAGKADKASAAQFFPALDHVMAFPTMIVIDKQNQVRQIHTGFDGPATSKYADFKLEFTRLIQDLR